MKMESKFFRTGKTELTNDELILFDVIFDGSCPVNSLRKEKFADWFNTKPHTLSDKQLKETLTKLNQKKLVRFIENQDSLEKVTSRQFRKIKATFVELTSKGGRLWEKEREPIWGKYCEGWMYSPFKDENKMLMEVVSPSLQTLNTFLKASKDIGFNGLTEDHEITFVVEKRKFIVGIRWKRFEELHTATITGVYDENTLVDWDKYYENLDWWGNIHELNLIKENY